MSIIHQYLKKVEGVGHANSLDQHIHPALKPRPARTKRLSKRVGSFLLVIFVLVMFVLVWHEPLFKALFWNEKAPDGHQAVNRFDQVEAAGSGKGAAADNPEVRRPVSDRSVVAPSPRSQAGDPSSGLMVSEGSRSETGSVDNPAIGPVVSEKPATMAITVENTGQEGALSNEKTEQKGLFKVESYPTGSGIREQKATRDDSYQMGLLAMKERNYRQAEACFSAVLRKDPESLDALTNLSAVYIEQERYDQARKSLERARELGPHQPKVLVNLGMVEVHSGALESAKGLFHQALGLNPREESALLNLAYLGLKQGDLETAEVHLKRLLEIRPAHLDALLTLASVNERRGKIEDAVALYRESLRQVQPGNGDASLKSSIRNRIRLLLESR